MILSEHAFTILSTYKYNHACYAYYRKQIGDNTKERYISYVREYKEERLFLHVMEMFMYSNTLGRSICHQEEVPIPTLHVCAGEFVESTLVMMKEILHDRCCREIDDLIKRNMEHIQIG